MKELLIVLLICATLLVVCIAAMATREGLAKNEVEFSDPTADVVLIGKKNDWRLYKLTLNGKSEFVWLFPAASSAIHVGTSPQPLEKTP